MSELSTKVVKDRYRGAQSSPGSPLQYILDRRNVNHLGSAPLPHTVSALYTVMSSLLEDEIHHTHDRSEATFVEIERPQASSAANRDRTFAAHDSRSSHVSEDEAASSTTASFSSSAKQDHREMRHQLVSAVLLALYNAATVLGCTTKARELFDVVHQLYLSRNELNLVDRLSEWITEKYQLQQLFSALEEARTYKEWAAIAVKIDKLRGHQQWSEDPNSHCYDYKLINLRLETLKNLRKGDSLAEIAHNLRAGLHRNLGGIASPLLYSHSLVGTKSLVQQYINEVVIQLKYLAAHRFNGYSQLEKLVFFRETRHSFGRTALLLSGGATMTMYHLGVIKALSEGGVLPRIVSGSSGGAIVAAYLCVTPDDQLTCLFRPGAIQMQPFERLTVGSVRRKLQRLLTKGVLFDVRVLQAFVRKNVGEFTFLEAYRRTHRVLNITVTSTATGGDSGRLLNYLTAPNVLIWSAVIASCSIPFVYEPAELVCKDEMGNYVPYSKYGEAWCDGSIAHDLPMQRLSELFNVNQFIVSQTNPWVIPFLSMWESDAQVCDLPWNARGVLARCWFVMGNELRHYAQLLSALGILPRSFNKYLSLVSQKYAGDITIVPTTRLSDFLNVLSNPTDEFIQRCIRLSEMRTWSKLSLIQGRCAIEQTLEECVESIQQQVVSEPQHDDGLRLPPSAQLGLHRTPDMLHTPLFARAPSSVHTLPVRPEREGRSASITSVCAATDGQQSAESGASTPTQSPYFTQSGVHVHKSFDSHADAFFDSAVASAGHTVQRLSHAETPHRPIGNSVSMTSFASIDPAASHAGSERLSVIDALNCHDIASAASDAFTHCVQSDSALYPLTERTRSRQTAANEECDMEGTTEDSDISSEV